MPSATAPTIRLWAANPASVRVHGVLLQFPHIMGRVCQSHLCFCISVIGRLNGYTSFGADDLKSFTARRRNALKSDNSHTIPKSGKDVPAQIGGQFS